MDLESASFSASAAAGHDVVLISDTDDRYKCPICLLILRAPVQTSCGHRFCKVCLDRIISNNLILKCPVDKTFSKVKMVFPDLAIQREILSLQVQCNNQAEGCGWSGELRAIDLHIESCEFEMVVCPHSCGERMYRGVVEQHGRICASRKVECEFCATQIICSALQEHKNECPKQPAMCQQCGDKTLLRGDLESHTDPDRGSCPLAVTSCPFRKMGCTYKAARVEVNKHTKKKECIMKHLELVFANLQDVEIELKTTKDQLETYKSEAENAHALVSAQEQRFEKLMRDIITRNTSGKIHWKVRVTGLSRRSQIIESPIFYTGNPGYRVRLALDMDGHREGNLKFIGLSLCLMPGEYDDQLLFPFNATCSVTVYDQKTNVNTRRMNHVMNIVVREMTRNRYSGDTVERSNKRGTSQFMHRHDVMGPSSRFLRNGHIVMEVQVVHGVYPQPDEGTRPSFCISPIPTNQRLSSTPVVPYSPVVSVASFSLNAN